MRGAASCVLLALAGMTSGCPSKQTVEDKPDAADAGPRAQELALALPGCHPLVAGGSALLGVTPGVLSIAATNGKALVVSSSTQGEEAAPTSDPGHVVPSGGGTGAPQLTLRTRAESVVLGPTGAAESPAEVLANDVLGGGGAPDAGAGSSRTFAAAAVLGGELTTLTYAVRHATLTGCADAVLAAKAVAPAAARRELLPHACRPASMLRAAGRGGLGIALATSRFAPTVEAWLLDGSEAKPALLETLGAATGKDGGASGPPTVSLPAVAAGSSSVAAAYVVARGATRELHVARLGGHGDPPARVELLDKDHVGSVAVAFEDDTLHVVWSSFVPEKKRSLLRWSKWPAGGAPTAAQTIGTGVLSASKPSLAIDHGRFLLAWTEGDDKATTVKVGASRKGLASVAGLATVVSSAGATAEAPAVAVADDALFVTWVEQSSVRAAALKCLE